MRSAGMLVAGLVWMNVAVAQEAPSEGEAVPVSGVSKPRVERAVGLDSDGRKRLIDLFDDTESMSQDERAAYLLALVNAEKEDPAVLAALKRGLIATEDGEPYEDALDAALGPKAILAPVATGPDEAVTPETLRAIRQYRTRHLEVRSEIRYTGGGTSYYGGPFGLGGWGRDPVRTTQGWAVYQGPTRLDVPRYLELTGQTEQAADLQGRIDRKKWLSRTYYGIGLVGGIAALAGYVAVSNTNDPVRAEQWATVGTVGLGASVVGFIGGSIPAGGATRLRQDYDRTTDANAAQEAVDVYNEQLRTELELSPAQALEVERSYRDTVRVR